MGNNEVKERHKRNIYTRPEYKDLVFGFMMLGVSTIAIAMVASLAPQLDWLWILAVFYLAFMLVFYKDIRDIKVIGNDNCKTD